MSEVTVLGACHHDCPDTCAWQVTVVDGVATRLRGSDTHPVTRGTLCPKVNRFLDRVYHPERIRRPLRRIGPKGSGEFEPITWEEALSQTGGRIRELMDAGRASSILQFSFAGTQGVIQMGIMIDRLFDAIGASDIRRELCGTTAALAASDVLGIPYGIDPESLRHAKTIVLWGTNTRITNRHLWPVLEEARADGAVIVVVDPVRTDTAREADVFLQVRPGSDVGLVLALVHVIDRDGLVDHDWLRERTTGWEELRDSARSWTPERAATATGLDEEQITWLAHRLATVRPAGIRALIGPEHRENGREIMRAIAMLPAVLGSWRDVGGGLARSTHVWHSRALAMPTDRPLRQSVNMARLGQVLCDPREGDPQIDMLVVHNSNPAVILPDQNRVVLGLEREDLFTVVIEQFMTDTARYADIVLPATTQVEHLDLADAWGHLYLALNQPAIAPVGEALPNTEIARRLATAIGLDDPSLHQTDEELIRAVLDSGNPFLRGITFERLMSEGWVRLAVPEGARPHVDELPGIPTGTLRLGRLEHRSGDDRVHATGQVFPLALISRKQHPKFLNANYGGFPAHLPSSGTPSLQIHERDAQARGISTGDIVRVHNDRGELTLRAEVSDDLQPGLVAIPFGWWHRSSPERRAVNALTNPALPGDDRGSAFFHDTQVEVTPIGQRFDHAGPA